MILPCRIHRVRTACIDSLPLALLIRRFFARSATGTDPAERVAGAAGSTSEDAGASWLPNIPPLRIRVTADVGYDSTQISPRGGGGGGGGSEFTRGNASLSYDRREAPTRFDLTANGGFTHYLNATNTPTMRSNTSNDDVRHKPYFVAHAYFLDTAFLRRLRYPPITRRSRISKPMLAQQCALQSLGHDRYLFAGLSLAPTIYYYHKLHVHAR